ncbi:cryptochrome-1 isoform X2 [Aristolochia californica]|uniref:cryptochrome-1 isoform X2 n=1 Tax=Aristolochia californica TaxID=171875 RepID=UPI0035E39D1C
MAIPSTTIVWFRRDLRIEDNPALVSAAKAGCVLPVYIWCPVEDAQFYPGRVSRWWLKQSLIHLHQYLRSLGVDLVSMKAESSLSALLKCIAATGASKVVYNHLYDPLSLVRDHNINQQLVERGISVSTFNGDLLFEPWEVYDDQGQAFTTFDAYWNKCMSLNMELTSLLPPRRLLPSAGSVESCSIEDLGLENEMEKSSNALLGRGWTPGWSSADRTLSEFVAKHLIDYLQNRMRLSGPTTSMLSPYLHFGELSVRKVFHCVCMKQIIWAREENSMAEQSVNLFLRAIGLREYSRYLCFNFPFTHERSLMGHLKHFPWQTDQANFKAWRQGRTGYPLVDAAMRELWATGWLHNKTRVIVSSFSVKFLLLPWTWGMKYFWDTLLDADLESDILGWQYISGSLPDGHELDRLDDPKVQGCKFDPEGDYVRHWIPELARMPTEWIHHPWNAPISVLKAAGVELGLNYPRPIVEINMARERLADALSVMWETNAAVRSENINGITEVVADNSTVMENLDIPRVPVNKRISSASSSHDQKVPAIQIGQLCERKISKGFVGERLNRGYSQDTLFKGETSVIDDDLCSTAESSPARKQRVSDGKYCVAPSYSSSSNERSMDRHEAPNLVELTSNRTQQELLETEGGTNKISQRGR